MNEVKPVLNFNDRIPTFKEHLKTTNMGTGKFTCGNMKIELNNNLLITPRR